MGRRSGRPRPARRPSPIWILAAAVVLLAAVLGPGAIRGLVNRSAPVEQTLFVADEITAEQGYDPAPPGALVQRALDLARSGEVRLVLVRGAGPGAVQALPDVELRAERDAGEPEHDPAAARRKISQQLTKAFRDAAAVPVPAGGRDTVGLIRAIADRRGSGPIEVWLRTLGLPTVAPADCRILTAADPEQAIGSIADRLPDLTGVEIHPVLMPPAGDQPQLNARTDKWRRGFIEALLRATNATLDTTEQVRTPLTPATQAPAAPVVPLIPDVTPTPPTPPGPPDQPTRTVLDSAATFEPDQAVLAAGEQQVLAELASIVSGARAGRYVRVVVVGHTAAYGRPESARALSLARARLIAGLLEHQHVQVTTVRGVGFDEPLPPDPKDKANRVVVVTAYPRDPK